MTTHEIERDELIMNHVSSLLDQPKEERAAYLLAACGYDPALCEEIAERVEWEERMGDFLRQPVIAAIQSLDHPFNPGQDVLERFDIIREVGRGGMGIVYEAFDRKLKRRVAIKAALPGYGQSLPPEARAAREVSHFNVCKLYDLHSVATAAGDVEFLSMEFLEGETLHTRINRAGPIQGEKAKDLVLQICSGLAQAHRQGVVHGDLKCGNIILTKSSAGSVRAVLTDFGLATLRHTEGETGLPAVQGGSFDYMAPELLAGSQPSVASDVFALGVVLHFMLSGKLPGWAGCSPFSREVSTVTMTPDISPGLCTRSAFRALVPLC